MTENSAHCNRAVAYDETNAKVWRSAAAITGTPSTAQSRNAPKVPDSLLQCRGPLSLVDCASAHENKGETNDTGIAVSSANQNPSILHATAMNLYDELIDSLTKCPLSQNKFLPLNILQDIITVESVLANTDSIATAQTLFSNGGLAVEVVQRAKKVFASLIFVGRESAIGDLLSEGLTDEQLPLSRRGSGDDRNLLSGRDGNKTFETFREWNRADVDHFLEKQWRVQAPVFDTTGGHFSLHRECALPLMPQYEQIGSTGFSKVFGCELHSAHYQQGSQAEVGQLQVAVKELRDQKSFEREKDNLARIQNLNNRHLIKHIATCQRDSSYYIIFPLANGGNLLEYWEHENKTPRGPELILWSFQQMLGLAGAIRALHHDLDGNKHCRHGDLKPANILLFKEDGDDFLAIADLGVSRIHDQPTVMRRSGTTTMATTRSYEAPEVFESERQGQPRARTYDIWSLGCVFLEFAIWLLYDFNAIKNFEANRLRPDKNPNASFYQMTSVGKAEIPSEVSDAIKALREDPRCQGGTALESLVILIEDKLLVTAVKDRCKAEELCNELQKIVQDAEQDHSHLLNASDQPPPTPKVFLHVGQASRTW